MPRATYRATDRRRGTRATYIARVADWTSPFLDVPEAEWVAANELAFAVRERPVYGTMFDPHFPIASHPELLAARDGAFNLLRRAAQSACAESLAPRKPPPLMVALHIWSMTHGIADLFTGEGAVGQLPITPGELLEAGLLVYLQALIVPQKN